MKAWSPRLFALGVGVSVCAALVLASLSDSPVKHADPSSTARGINSPISEGGFKPDVNPLVDGARLTLSQAKEKTPFKMPIPPQDSRTGGRAGIWIDSHGQLAMTWESGLRMYVEQSQLSEEEVEAHWRSLASKDPQRSVVTLRGDHALYSEGEGAFGVVFTERGLTIEINADSDKVSETQFFSSIEDIVFED